VQREAVVRGDEIDAGAGLAAVVSKQIARAGEPFGQLADAAAIAAPEPADRVAAAVVPLGRSLCNQARDAVIFSAYTLGNIGDDSAINDLIPILSDSDDEKRLAAIEAIAIIGAPRSRSLIEPLIYDPSEKVGKTAEYWCSKLKGRE